jgi:hypothetical protein
MVEIIVDGMKKEGKTLRNIMIMGFVMSVLMPITIYFLGNVEYTNKEYIIMALFFIFIGLFGLYGWLYSLKYNVVITEDKIIVKTIFKHMVLQLKDIRNYSYKRYRKTVFYQFKLYAKDKTILISTRYKNEVIEHLGSKGIFERA